jgi:hypothetical protein
MKILIIFLLANIISVLAAFSQGTSINNTGAEPDPSAGLDVNFANKGLLIPRLTDSQRDAIDNPAVGLIIYNTTTECFNVFKTTGWFEWCGTCVIPSAPEVIGGSNATTTSIQANWSVYWGATSYYLDVSADISFSGFLEGYNNLNVGNVTSYNVTGLTSNTTYYITV